MQSRALSGLIKGVAYGIAALMGIGAVFGDILTMSTAVARRSREIATQRALGFNTTPVVVAVLAESLALSAIGGAFGGLAAYLGFNVRRATSVDLVVALRAE